MKEYDIAVIGAGSGGVRLARMCASQGKRVAIVESTFLGGTCVNVGCVPKKLFVYASHFGEDLHDAAGYGWHCDNIRFDWPTLRDNKTKEIQRLNGIYEKLLVNSGVELYRGFASFVDGQTLNVETEDKSTTISAEKIVIATGSTPFLPDIPGKDLLCTSADMFYLDALPEKAVVWGGGYIAVEFAGILHGLGVETHLVYRGDLFLRGFDEEVRHFIRDEMEKKGVHLHFGKTIESVEAGDSGQLTVQLSDQSSLQAGLVMAATGRVPLVGGLNLSEAGVNCNDKGEIVVDGNFATSNPQVFALGDVIGGLQLTPVALAEAMALTRHFVSGEPVNMDYELIPTAVFTQPNIGTVGLSEEAARAQFSDVDVYKSRFTPMKHTLTASEEKMFMKMLVDRTTDKVLGVHVVGESAGEIVQAVAVAMKAGATKSVFDTTIGIHPTAAEELVTMREPS